MTGIYQKVFLRALSWLWDHGNRWRIGGDMTEWSLWQRAKLEGKRKRECWNCKGFRHLACNCRNRKEGEKRMAIPQNKFEVLKSRVMQCKVEERTIRRQEIAVVECFKCGEEGQKCREYKGTAWDCLDNLVGFTLASIPMDPRSLQFIVLFPLVQVSITVLYSYIW